MYCWNLTLTLATPTPYQNAQVARYGYVPRTYNLTWMDYQSAEIVGVGTVNNRLDSGV